MSLGGGYKVGLILNKVLNISIDLNADIAIHLWSWCISYIAAIREDGRVYGGD